MAGRAHCKLLYDEDEDMHEYEPFYDFSVSYGDAQEGDFLRDDQDAVAAEEAGAGAEAEADETPEGDGVEPSRALGMTDIGELVLFDGKTVGSRSGTGTTSSACGRSTRGKWPSPRGRQQACGWGPCTRSRCGRGRRRPERWPFSAASARRTEDYLACHAPRT